MADTGKKSPWPSPTEAMNMVMKLAKDIKKSGSEIYDEYKAQRAEDKGRAKSKKGDKDK